MLFDKERKMKRTRFTGSFADLPEIFWPFLKNAVLYDSSCSAAARVLFIDKEGGFYLKAAEKGSLRAEADMTRYFHRKGLGAEVLAYHTNTQDWLLTARVPGEDATHASYLADPRRLADTMAEALRMLHELNTSGCPVSDHAAGYFALAEKNYRAGQFDRTGLPPALSPATAEEAWCIVSEGRHLLRQEVLLHGDYCLPNIMLDDWKLSGFVDLGNGGVGDRHIDLYWGAWTLCYNLKTDQYRQRFLDAYGRDLIDLDRMRVVAAAETFG